MPMSAKTVAKVFAAADRHAELHATASWRRISEDIWPFMDSAPSADLGRQAAAWATERGRP